MDGHLVNIRLSASTGVAGVGEFIELCVEPRRSTSLSKGSEYLIHKW